MCGGKYFDFLFTQGDKFNLYRCKNCNTIITNPKLSFKELEEYYPKDYYAFDKIKTRKESVKVDLRLFLYDIYYNMSIKSNLLRVLCSPFKFLIRGTQIIPGKKLLDVGCGSGQFLYEMNKCGLDVYGIEPGKKSQSKFNIKSDLFKAKYSEESFDIVTMNHVLQHVDNPKRMLKEIHKILKPNGLFIVSASNTRSLTYFLFRENWFQLDIPRHLFNCSDKTLMQFLEENGFWVIKNRHNSRPNQFVVSLYHLFGVKNNGGFINRILEIGFLPLTWIVNILKIGDQVEIWCIKK